MPALTLLFSLIVLSQSAPWVRLADTHAVAIGFWRMTIALPILILLALGKGRVKLLGNLVPGQWLRLVLCGFFLSETNQTLAM